MKWWNKLNKWMDWRGIGWRDIITAGICMVFILSVVGFALASFLV